MERRCLTCNSFWLVQKSSNLRQKGYGFCHNKEGLVPNTYPQLCESDEELSDAEYFEYNLSDVFNGTYHSCSHYTKNVLLIFKEEHI